MATLNMIFPPISGGLKNRCVASYSNHAVMIQIVKMEQNAPRISTRWYPNVYFELACLCAMCKAQIEMPKPITSEAMWAASDKMAIEFA